MEMLWADIAASWPNIALAWAALFLMAVSPGPSVMAIMSVSMAYGRRSGFIFTTGCMTGAATWATLAALGLSAWLTRFAHGIIILKIFGGLYLIWMAYKALKSALTADEKLANHPKIVSERNLYSGGLALHLTNPKSILGWAAVMTLSQSENGSTTVLIFTVLSCLAITIFIHFAYATIFASSAAMVAYRKARRWIEGVLAAVFSYAGMRLLAVREEWNELYETRFNDDIDLSDFIEPPA